MPKPLARSFAKALLAGLAGGLVGSAAKVLAEKLVPPRTQGQEPPPKVMVERAEKATGYDLPPAAEKAAEEGMHWAFGMAAGAVYGVVTEYRPGAASWRGAGFGLALNKLMHEGVLPKTGIVEPVAKQPFQERMSEWVTHVVYGLAVEATRRAVRKRL